MEQTVCKQCRYYIQHYALGAKGVLHFVNCGHCIKDRPKSKKPDRKSCEDFVPQEEKTEQYVTKEYLRRELLKKVLDMELLPEELQE